MSLKIKKLTGEVFDLPKDYVIEGEKNNPLFFPQKGSQTVAINFPRTDKNRRLLLHSDRLDRLERPDIVFPVFIETDSMQQSGIMAINSAFNAGIGFDESEMYNQMTAMQLRDMPVLNDTEERETVYKKVGSGSTKEDKITDLLNHLTQVMKEQVEADYFIFPVVIGKETVGEWPLEKNYCDVINDIGMHFETGICELLALNQRLIKHYINGEEIVVNVPKGYSVSPFIKVWKLLEIIFENFDFQIDENPFKEHRQLKKLVVLNNVMDAIMTGTLCYRDMMPDITIEKFLNALYSKFGMLYAINSNSKKVQIKFLKDIINYKHSNFVNLDKFKTEEPVLSYSSPKQLKITANRKIKGSETLADTFEEFLKKYNFGFSDDSTPSIYNRSTSKFKRVTSDYVIYNALLTPINDTLYSSDFFDYDKKDTLSYEEIKQEDLCLPLISGVAYVFELMVLFYDVKFKQLYTDLIVQGEKTGEINNPAELAFAFGWGTDKHDNLHYFFASQINRDAEGNFIYDEHGNKYDISLTINGEDGLFNRFWKEYDAFLRHSNFEIKCKLKLSDPEIFNLDIFKPAILNNQPLIPNQIKYKLNQDKKPSECTFQSLRLYEPHDLKKEQEILQYEHQKYYWKISRIDTPVLDGSFQTEGYLSENRYPDEIVVNGQLTKTSTIFLYPPTKVNDLFEFQYDWVAIYQSSEVNEWGVPLPPLREKGTSYFTMIPVLNN